MSLPIEIINKILFTHKGLEHKNAKIIKDYMKENYMIPYESLKETYKEYNDKNPNEQLQPSESVLDIDFITSDLINIRDEGNFNKYHDLWEDEYFDFFKPKNE